MGNQLSGVAPSHPLSAEHHLAELSSRISKEMVYKKNLGSTRFFKVVMCLSDKGPVVVKIFIIQDATLPLVEEKKKIKEIESKLYFAVNCLPYKKVELMDKIACIMRPFIKSSLYDRISTRPFLAPIEKKWLAFQLLCALNQSHQQKICHGDVKLENILVTSWSWLILTDFASYKPVLLPEDNPTHFTYYFDTSRRRVCHIAPERFIKTIYNGEFVLKPPQEDEAYLTHAMDMFSAGCVLAELFTEGLCPFNLMQLLQYRSNHYYPTEVLDKITDSRARSMVEQMIKKDPSERGTAAAYLEREKGNLFPEYFYTFFHPFFRQFSLTPALTADERIQKIEDSLPDIITSLEIKKMYGSTRPTEETDEEGDSEETDDEGDRVVQNESLVILISLITSCVRALQYPSSKLTTLELFCELSEYSPNDIILDRILPYIFNLLKDSEPRVRAESIYTLAHCLKLVNAVPRSEANIFLEYILPSLNEVSSDQSTIVRQADAANISYIADAAKKFLQYCSEHCPDYSPDTQTLALEEVFSQKLAKIFSNSCIMVKRALMDNNLLLLCNFFGKEKANDPLISHLMTFLNESNYHVRISFYNNVPDIVSFITSNRDRMLKPLFLQGLSDAEEGVAVAAINNMSKLTEKGVFPYFELIEIVNDSSPLLVHPNKWIRLAMVGLIVAISKRLEYFDGITTLAIKLSPYFTDKGFQEHDRFILSRLKEPLPRNVYDFLVKADSLNKIFKILDNIQKKKIGLLTLINLPEDKEHNKNVYEDIGYAKIQVIKRLVAAGLTDSMVGLVMLMKDHLFKVNKHSKNKSKELPDPQLNQQKLIILDNKLEQQPILHKCKLITKENSVDLTSNLLSSSHSLQKSSNLTMNEEWQTMFGNGGQPEENRSNSGTLMSSKQSSMGTSLSSQCFMVDPSSKDSSKKYVAPCQQELEQLLHRKREELLMSMQGKGAEGGSSLSGKWKPKGTLVAHVHEHSAAITKLIPLKGTTFYASSSKDGTVKVWDANKTERTYPINRSKFTYTQQHGSTISSVAYCSAFDSIASASDNSSIHVFKLDRQSLVASRQLDKKIDGYALDLNYMDAGSRSLLAYSTVYGKIYGWDLRSPGNAWEIDNSVKNGLLSTFVIDDNNNWLACGTSIGLIVCWDLRFMLNVSSVKNYHLGHPIQCLKTHPNQNSWVISSTRYNNEVGFFNMETKSRTKTLWANFDPPFSQRKQKGDNWFHTLWAEKTGTEDKDIFVITGGTDCRIRYWDLQSPNESYVISQGWSNNPQYSHAYLPKVINDSEVIIEKTSPLTSDPKAEDTSMRPPDQPCTGHIETITGLIVVNQPQKLLISGANDGAIKIWK